MLTELTLLFTRVLQRSLCVVSDLNSPTLFLLFLRDTEAIVNCPGWVKKTGGLTCIHLDSVLCMLPRGLGNNAI